MKVCHLFLICLWACSALSPQKSASPAHSLVLLEHVSLIDSTGSPPKSGVSVLIEGDRIKSILPSNHTGRTTGATSIDAKGKFLIAGLWDMHVHALSKANQIVSSPYLLPMVLPEFATWEETSPWRRCPN